ncbi:MAG: hypothetical protein H6838_10765 [Planctomycetes bacterium]|nr:hypothetical protein [Planctomycetota bacterium]MCB9885968.1 hypothetical protein [Planctomycetota bacterium]
MFIGRVCALAVCAALAAPAFAQKPAHPKPSAKPAASAPAAKPHSFAVVKDGDALQVLDKADVATRQKALDAEYAAAMKRFEEAKKAAEAAKQPFAEKTPQKPHLAVVASFPSKTAAEAAMKKMEDEQAKKEKGKGDAEHGKPAPQKKG